MFKISLSNFIGFLSGVSFVVVLTKLTQSEGGYLYPYADRLAGWCSAFLGPVQFSVVLAAVAALLVSFVVSHIIEKV